LVVSLLHRISSFVIPRAIDPDAFPADDESRIGASPRLVGRPGEEENLMRMIVSIIQPHRLEAVKQCLTDVEVFRLTVSDVQGYGRQKGHTEYFRGQPMQVNLIRKVRLDIAVNDNFVQPTINAIVKGARSGEGGKGQVGDGKIFVIPLENVVRISDGVQGGEAI
jgi:nitrogen regulatory protein P-II 2